MNVFIHYLDAATEVLFTSSLPTYAAVLEGTEVTFVCIADSNPVPTLMLIIIKDTDEVFAYQISKSWTVSIFLTKDHDGFTFMCRANGSDPEFSIDSSNRYTYSIQCKCTQCFFYPWLVFIHRYWLQVTVSVFKNNF